MKKRIYLNMILLIALSLIVVTAALCLVFYRQFAATALDDLRSRAEIFSDNTSQTAIEALADTNSADMRVTVIEPGGAVVFDNTAEAASLPNHGDREEVRAAFAGGSGHSSRYSATLQQETVYYAVRLDDGYVLRLAKTVSSIFGVFIGIAPLVAGLVLLLLVAGYALAGRLTKNIIAPINSVDLAAELSAPYDELAPFIRTIAEQREKIALQLADLHSRTETISAIFDNINEGIILTDKQGQILSASSSLLRVFSPGVPLTGKNILEFLRDVEFCGHVRAALNGQPGEMSMEQAGHTYRVYFSHVRGGGAIILFLDISEKAKAEKLRREFSANVSHELKTPLTSIFGNAEMLASGMVKDSDRQAFYSQIKDEAGRLITLIDDILLISRLDEGAGQDANEPVNLADVAAEIVASLALKAAEHQVTVRIIGEGLILVANRSLMYELLYNLIDNAVKYNRPGGTVQVELARRENQLQILVADSGLGIAPEAQGRVFERFYRVERSRSKKTGGTGLGLAIVKHIVIAQGGKIELASEPGEGTTFTVSFPL